jgi:hypothetical protein
MKILSLIKCVLRKGYRLRMFGNSLLWEYLGLRKTKWYKAAGNCPSKGSITGNVRLVLLRWPSQGGWGGVERNMCVGSRNACKWWLRSLKERWTRAWEIILKWILEKVVAQNLLGCTAVFLIKCRHSIKNTAVHPRRFWATYSPPWELEISPQRKLFGGVADWIHLAQERSR